MTREPPLDLGMLMRAGGVADDVNVELGLDGRFDGLKEVEPLLMPMPRLEVGQHGAIGHIERVKRVVVPWRW